MNTPPIGPPSDYIHEMPRAPLPPPPPSHWTWSRVGKIAGFSLLGATGIASLAAGALSLVIAPIAAIPWFIAGALVLGYSSYKVIQTAKKTEQVASRVFHTPPSMNIDDSFFEEALKELKDKTGLLGSESIDRAFLEGERDVSYFLKGFVPRASTGHKVLGDVELNENVSVPIFKVFSSDLNRMDIYFEGENMREHSPESFCRHLFNKGLTPDEIIQIMHLVNQESEHVNQLKLQLLYAEMLEVPIDKVFIQHRDARTIISDPAVKPVSVTFEVNYTISIIDYSKDSMEWPEQARGKVILTVPDITNTDPEALDATLQINETDRRAKPL